VSGTPVANSRPGFREGLQRMKILVANLGSTSFKYRLFDLPAETQLARGGIDRIGEVQSACFVEIGGHREEVALNVPDHAAAVRICLDQLMHPEWGCVKSVSEVSAIGFKAVFAGRLSGVRIVDDALLAKMEELSDIAPAHNPMYAKAMRLLQKAFPEIPLVAALETAFHETIPEATRCYAVPYEWKTEPRNLPLGLSRRQSQISRDTHVAASEAQRPAADHVSPGRKQLIVRDQEWNVAG